MSNILDAFNRRFSTESEGGEETGFSGGVNPEHNDSGIEISEDGETLSASETLEGIVIQEQEEEAQVDEAIEQHDEIEQTAEAVESFLTASIEARQAGQYWSAQTAAMTERGLQAIMLASGGSADFKVRQLAGENFSGRRDAESAMISFENAVTDMLKNLWQKLKDMLKKIYRKVRDFFTKHFSAVGMLKKRAEAIKKKAQNLDRAPGSKKITCASIDQIKIDGKEPGADKIVSAMNLYTKALGNLTSGQTVSTYSDGLDKLSDVVEDHKLWRIGDLTLEDGDKAYNELSKKVAKLFSTSEMPEIKNQVKAADTQFAVVKTGNKEEGRYTDTLPGEVVLLFVEHKMPANQYAIKVSDVKNHLANTRLLITLAKEKTKEYQTDREVKPLTVAEILNISTSVVDFCEEALQFKNAYEKYEKANDRFIAKMDKIANGRAGNDDDNEQQRARMAIASGASAFSKNVISWIKSINSHGVRTGRASLDFCNASLNAPRKD